MTPSPSNEKYRILFTSMISSALASVDLVTASDQELPSNTDILSEFAAYTKPSLPMMNWSNCTGCITGSAVVDIVSGSGSRIDVSTSDMAWKKSSLVKTCKVSVEGSISISVIVPASSNSIISIILGSLL